MKFSQADFVELCSNNRDLQAELSCSGDLILMAPTGGNSGWRISMLTFQLEACHRPRIDSFRRPFGPPVTGRFDERRRTRPSQYRPGGLAEAGVVAASLDSSDGVCHPEGVSERVVTPQPRARREPT